MATVSIRFSERLKQEKIFAPEKADAFASALNDELSDQLATKSDLHPGEERYNSNGKQAYQMDVWACISFHRY